MATNGDTTNDRGLAEPLLPFGHLGESDVEADTAVHGLSHDSKGKDKTKRSNGWKVEESRDRQPNHDDDDDDDENHDDDVHMPLNGNEATEGQLQTSTHPSMQTRLGFSIKNEVIEMASLGFPLAVSFFCRMGMASTDSAFVGHLHDEYHSAETYLAAAVLSDMVLNICITPPLAFNQVLNGLVAQAMGSNNPSMAGVWVQQSMFWLAISMLPCLTGLFFVRPILERLGFPSEIAAVAGLYAKYNLIWPIPNGLYQCMRFYFQARGLPRPAMYNNIIFLFVNAGLNWILVMGGPFRWWYGWNGFGFIGAAISISISRTMQSVCYYLYMFVYKEYHKEAWPEQGWSLVHHTQDRTLEFMRQSLPNIGTLLFQVMASQATTVLVGRLGELSIASSAALSTVCMPWSGTLSATCSTISGVRVGFHLGRGDAIAAKKSSWLVIHFITLANILVAAIFLVPNLRRMILSVATNDDDVLGLASTLVPAMLASTYLNLIVGNITSGVFGGQGRPIIATVLSFGLELPLTIGGVAIYILVFHGNLLGVYWLNVVSGGIEAVIVIYLMAASNWDQCAEGARQRQEDNISSNATSGMNDDEEDGGEVLDNDDNTEALLRSSSAPLTRSSSATTTVDIESSSTSSSVQ
jgi:MATE family multidrug resistance protein